MDLFRVENQEMKTEKQKPKKTNKQKKPDFRGTDSWWMSLCDEINGKQPQTKKIHKTPLKKRRRKPLYVTTHMSFWWREDKKGLQLFFNTY